MSEHADLSIGDVSKITGLPAHTIRYWEKEFSEFLSPDRTIGQQRRYDERDIEIIEEIRHLLKVEGFSIAGAKRQLSHRYPKKETAVLGGGGETGLVGDVEKVSCVNSEEVT